MNTKHTKNKILTNVCMASITSMCYGAHLDAMNTHNQQLNYAISGGNKLNVSLTISADQSNKQQDIVEQPTALQNEMRESSVNIVGYDLQALKNKVENELSGLNGIDQQNKIIQLLSDSLSEFYRSERINCMGDKRRVLNEDVVEGVFGAENADMIIKALEIHQNVVSCLNGKKVNKNKDKYFQSAFEKDIQDDKFVKWLCDKFASTKFSSDKKDGYYSKDTHNTVVFVNYKSSSGDDHKAVMPAFIYKALSDNEVASCIMRYFVCDTFLGNLLNKGERTKELQKIINKNKPALIRIRNDLNKYGAEAIKLLVKKDNKINQDDKKCYKQLLYVEVLVLDTAKQMKKKLLNNKNLISTDFAALLENIHSNLRVIYSTHGGKYDINTGDYNVNSRNVLAVSSETFKEYKKDIMDSALNGKDIAFFLPSNLKLSLANIAIQDGGGNSVYSKNNALSTPPNTLQQNTVKKLININEQPMTNNICNTVIQPAIYVSGNARSMKHNSSFADTNYCNIDISISPSAPNSIARSKSKKNAPRIAQSEAGHVDSLSLALNSNTRSDSITYKPGMKITQSPTRKRNVNNKLNDKQMIDKITINSIKKCDTLKEVIEVLRSLGFEDSEIQNIIKNIRSGSTKISCISDDVVSAISAKIAEIDELNTESRVIKRSRTTRKIRDSEREVESQDVDDVFAKPIKKSRSSSKMEKTSAKRKSRKPVVVEIDQDGGYSGYQTNYVVDGVQLHRQYS